MDTTTPFTPAPRPKLFEALQVRDFRLLWFASWIWQHARWMEVVVLGWIVLELTDSPWLVGLVAFLRMVPMPLLGMVAGIVADRASRRLMLAAVQALNIASMTTLFLLLLFDVAQFWHIALITLVMGIGFTVDFPARRSLIADMVGASRVTNAMSLEIAAMTGSKTMGPLYGGLLLSVTGAEGALLAIMVLYVCGFLLLMRVRFPERPMKTSPEPPLRMLGEGLAYVMRNRFLLGVLLVTAVANLILTPYMFMVPVFARDVLEVGPTLMGLLAASDGFGSLVGAVAVSARREIRSPGRIYVYGTTAAMVFVLGFSLSSLYGLSLVLLMLAGVAFSGFLTMQSTLMLLGSLEEMRGRALGTLLVAIGAAPAGTLITGAVAEAWGAPVAVAINCTVGLMMMIGILVWIPALRMVQPP